jgi:protein-L-isoaspartate O-methyltransferase
MTLMTRPPAGKLLPDTAWRSAFDAVPPDPFGPGEARRVAVAAMCEALNVPDGARVLEVGTGTGYGAALLSHRFGCARVVSLDADPGIVEAAGPRLARAGFAPALLTGEPASGCPPLAPFGAVLAGSGAGSRVPAAWPAQVLPGGTVVTVVASGIVALTVRGDGSSTGRFLPVPAAERPRAAASVRPYIPALLVPLGTRVDVELTADLGADVPRLLAGLTQPDVAELALIDADGRRVFGLVHPETGSWARIAPRDDGTARVQYDGPRDLWAERAPLLAAWARAGRPGPEGFGLTIGPDGRHRLWLGGPQGPGWTLR